MLRESMAGPARALAGLMLPSGCAGCGVPPGGAAWDAVDDGTAAGWTGALCAGCAGELGAPGRVRLVVPDARPAGLPPVWAAAAYAGIPRAVLLAHKERGALALARPLGAALAAAAWAAVRGGAGAGDPPGDPPSEGRAGGLHGRTGRPGGLRGPGRGGRRGAIPGAVLLVPVPSARRAVAARGHDPVRRIARVAADRLRRRGVPAELLPALRQLRPVADQAGLSAVERQRNVAGAFAVAAGGGRRLRGWRIVLVDDVLTTGASLAEAARAVRGAAGRVCGAAVVAAPRDAFEVGRGCSAY